IGMPSSAVRAKSADHRYELDIFPAGAMQLIGDRRDRSSSRDTDNVAILDHTFEQCRCGASDMQFNHLLVSVRNMYDDDIVDAERLRDGPLICLLLRVRIADTDLHDALRLGGCNHSADLRARNADTIRYFLLIHP